jgi:predicted transcriptional regulator
MNPIDYRNATWLDVQQRINPERARVLELLRMHGPCTTRHLANASGEDILSIRPRVTELVQLGLAELVDLQCNGSRACHHEGVYHVVPLDAAMANFSRRCHEAQDAQTMLKLEVP